MANVCVSLNSSKSNLKRGFSVVMFIALMGASMLGAQFFGMSLNKIALLPLELYLIWWIFHNRKIVRLHWFSMPLFAFYFVQIVGSLVALLNKGYGVEFPSYKSTLFSNIIQYIFIYVPILVCIMQIDNRTELYSCFKKNICRIARIHAIFVIVQFALWHIFRFNFNGFLFETIFPGLFKEEHSSTLINIGGDIRLRATGLNYEPAAMALVMLLGFCFDAKWIWKILYFVCTLLGMSRTGTVVLFLCLIVNGIYFIYSNWLTKFAGRQIFYACVVFVALIIGGGLMVMMLPSLNEQIMSVIERFVSMGESAGSNRHIMYPIAAVHSWFCELGLIEKFIGVGGRVTGIVLLKSPYANSVMEFMPGMYVDSWEIECDYAAILLGEGLIGFVSYLLVIISFLIIFVR